MSPSCLTAPEQDEPATRTIPCFFHRFCMSISMELMNNSNMNIIHCIWAGVISGRVEIKSSKRLASPAPAEGRWMVERRAALGSHHPTPGCSRAPRCHQPGPPGTRGCQARAALMVLGKRWLLRGALPL